MLNRGRSPNLLSLERNNVNVLHFRYWGHEAISEWLLSIDSYMHQLQMRSIRKSNYINIIVDETQDISVQKMVSICLRYVEQDTGTIKEEIFRMEPISDTTGEGKK
jgi:hypothetical protein